MSMYGLRHCPSFVSLQLFTTQLAVCIIVEANSAAHLFPADAEKSQRQETLFLSTSNIIRLPFFKSF
ncbi:MAG: hypothetical protein JWM14_2071 [Chitinophagaceae bacterium]|nr:hypothetical protein [Chitinophagaceae bacterium]